MKIMWEYERIESDLDSPDTFMNLLNEKGDEGWELVYYEENRIDANDYKFVVVLKRKVNNNT